MRGVSKLFSERERERLRFSYVRLLARIYSSLGDVCTNMCVYAVALFFSCIYIYLRECEEVLMRGAYCYMDERIIFFFSFGCTYGDVYYTNFLGRARVRPHVYRKLNLKEINFRMRERDDGEGWNLL